ncbi:flagellar export chaperone FliS [Radicibacter daui]|uniref:flagellar export chaperone FliS n=1 Tax=Radicibacter daui TaxID=3064829 RepID=UPI004046F648
MTRTKTSPARGASAYKAAVQTTPPLFAVVMLYDKALYHMANAARAAEKRDFEGHFNEVSKAVTIFNGLNRNLEMERGGRVGTSLRDMYTSLANVLLGSIRRPNGAEIIQKLIEAVRITRDAWAEIANSPAAHMPPAGGGEHNTSGRIGAASGVFGRA